MDSLKIVRACYEWQINNLKVDGWAKKLKEELEKTGLACIWQGQSEINVNICNIIRERCNDVERQNIFSDVNVKISLIFYCGMKYVWGKESFIDKCTRKERMGIILLKADLETKRDREGFCEGKVPPIFGGEGC
jgi:hypothetical protein